MFKKLKNKWNALDYSQKSSILISIIIFILCVFISIDWISTSLSFKYRLDYRTKNVKYWDRVSNKEILPNTNYSLTNDGINNEWRFKNDKLHFALNKLPTTSIIDWKPIILFLIILTNVISTGNAAVTSIKNFQMPQQHGEKMPKKQLKRTWFMFSCWAILLITIILIKKCSTDLDTYTETKIPIPIEYIMGGFGSLLVILGGSGVLTKISIAGGNKEKNSSNNDSQQENKLEK